MFTFSSQTPDGTLDESNSGFLIRAIQVKLMIVVIIIIIGNRKRLETCGQT